jgi:hypothetical protein
VKYLPYSTFTEGIFQEALIIEEFVIYPPVDPEASLNVPVPGKNSLNGKFPKIFFDLLN